ncbi:MAG TPA: pyridoxal-dependent decarboxylase [Candidatus Limnocylindrales bacterium]|nr:pyridoxal-dependent decarboxylase [Candidatus Limnocylindrales bacterium]
MTQLTEPPFGPAATHARLDGAAAADPDAGTGDLLRATAERAIAFRESLPRRRVGAERGLRADDLRVALGEAIPDHGEPAGDVIDRLIAAMEPGLVAIPGPRYFGFVMGGSVPASLAADWLTSAWDQNVAMFLSTPGAAVVEHVTADWLVDLFGLPDGTSVGFTTGATTATFTALAAARHAVLRGAGWDVEANGLIGAPEVDVVLGEDAHTSVFVALRMLGLGRDRPRRVAVDDEGRIRPVALRATLQSLGGRDRPTIVVAQAGEVNTGAFDDLDAVTRIVREERDAAWIHVDGAFGLWAIAVPGMRASLAGMADADSWTTDAHKWLNVPYDCGLVFVRDAAAHRAAMGMAAAYLPPAPGEERDPFDYVPEMSRRGRAIPVWAALRSLGRDGIAELVERCCTIARRMADALAAEPGIEIVNEVTLNQVLVRFGDDDDQTKAVIAAVQDDGTCWLGGTTWHGRGAMRISVSNWSTREADADRSVEAILRAYRATATQPGA